MIDSNKKDKMSNLQDRTNPSVLADYARKLHEMASNMEQETFIAEVQDLSRITIPKELVSLKSIKKGQKVKLAIIKVYKHSRDWQK